MTNNTNLELYNMNSEFTITELLSHFDSDIIIDIMKDKLSGNKYKTLPEPNIISSFEENFKNMNQEFPGDSQNINIIRTRVYREIIETLCEAYNLQFNYLDESIDLYSAAYYMYDFLVCNYSNILVNFFTSFIINNSDSLYKNLNLESLKKSKDSSTIYGKSIYDTPKYILISANLEKVINYISTLDVTINNIFASTYVDIKIIDFLNNIIADKGNFFKNFYCSILNKVEILPIVLTDIRLQLQNHIGNISATGIKEYINNDN